MNAPFLPKESTFYYKLHIEMVSLGSEMEPLEVRRSSCLRSREKRPAIESIQDIGRGREGGRPELGRRGRGTLDRRFRAGKVNLIPALVPGIRTSEPCCSLGTPWFPCLLHAHLIISSSETYCKMRRPGIIIPTDRRKTEAQRNLDLSPLNDDLG